MSDVRKFTSVDGEEIELNRRRIFTADWLKNYDLDQESDGPRIMVVYTPAGRSVDENDEPAPVYIDLRANPSEFAEWWGEPLGETDFATAVEW